MRKSPLIFDACKAKNQFLSEAVKAQATPVELYVEKIVNTQANK